MNDLLAVGVFGLLMFVLTAALVKLQSKPEPTTLHFDPAVTVKRRARVARIEKREER